MSHCQIPNFCYSAIQLGIIPMILNDSKERHYISEQNVQLFRRESRNAKVKITEILVQCEAFLRGFYLLMYYWKKPKLIQTCLSLQELEK